MIYTRHTCTAAFRAGLLALYPGLGTNRAYWRLMGALIFPQHPDDETGQVVLAQSYLASIDDKLPQYRQRNYRARVLLKSFKRDVLPDFAYSDWSYVDGKARVVTNTGLSADVDALVDSMHTDLNFRDAERVFLDDGLVYTDAARAALRNQQKSYADRAPKSPYVQRIADYQNGLKTSLYTRKINENWSQAFWVANSTMIFGELDARGLGTSRQGREALGVLDAIKAQPHPYLKAVENSTRLYGVGPSLQNLRRGLRRALTKGWVEYDLWAAQFAIAAKAWGVPEMETALRDAMKNGLSLWEKLSDDLGVAPHVYAQEGKYKDAFKTATYALAFGAAKTKIKTTICDKTGSADLANKFLAHPLIDALYNGRERRIECIFRDGGLTTIYGQRIDVTPSNRKQARTALAQEAQAYEVALIEPIYDLAIANSKHFKVPVYLFDGVLIQYAHPDTAKAWERKIKLAVQNKADALGIITRLDGSLDK